MKPQSYLLIVFLLLILSFILGVRYGQKVEKVNKVVDFIISLTPSISPTKTPTPTPLIFEEYKSKRWGLKFKYPAHLQIKESTNTAEILIEEKQANEAEKIK
jgi:ABC-type Fe3+-siderophore transport system permease subunit